MVHVLNMSWVRGLNMLVMTNKVSNDLMLVNIALHGWKG
jgi:hypothetical protein